MNTKHLVWIRVSIAALALVLLGAWPAHGNARRGVGQESQINSGENVRVLEDDSATPPSLTIELRTPTEQVVKNARGEDVILTPGFGRYGQIGEALLPHQQISIALPPNVDVQSLRLEILDTQTESLLGRYHLQVAEEAPEGCAPATDLEAPSVSLSKDQPGTCAIPNTGVSSNTQGSALTFSFNNSGDSLKPPAWDQSQGPLRLLRTGAMRKWRFAILDYAPYELDTQSGAVHVVRQARARLSYRLDPQADRRPDYAPGLQDTVMDDRAADAFVNYASARRWYDQAAAALPIQVPDVEQYDYVIITSSDIVANSTKLADFVAHKEVRGHKVWVVTELTFSPYIGPPPNRTAERIRAFLQANYLTHGFQYVLLVGDPDPDNPYVDGPTDPVGDIPMKMCYANTLLGKTWYTDAPTDLYYADLTGTWNPDGDQEYCSWSDYLLYSGIDLWADVIVGRIPLPLPSPRDYAGLDAILQKTMDYQDGLHSGDWQKSVLLPMSFHSADYDFAALSEQLDDYELIPRGLSHWRMYLQGNNICQLNSFWDSDEELVDGATLARLQASHYGVVFWAGHGSATATGIGFGTSTFYDGTPMDCWDGRILNTTDTAGLDNDHPAFVFQCSCLNGEVEVPNNLQTSLLKNGAVTVVGASRVTTPLLPQVYGEFGTRQSNAGIGYNYVKWLAMDADAGDALAIARELWLPSVSSEYLNILVFNLFGDPETLLGVEPNIAPEAPTNLQLTASYYSDRSVVLHWEDNSDIEERTIIERATFSGPWEPVKEVPNDVVQTSIPGNECGTPYWYRVKARNAIGDSGYSNDVHFSGFNCSPNSPVNVTVAPFLDDNVLIEWNTGGGGVSSYEVQRKRVALASSWIPIATVGIGFPYETNTVDTNVDCGVAYRYRVIACGTGGCSPPSQSATIAVTCAPAAPVNLSATPTSYHVNLLWIDASESESGYKVERALSEYLEWDLLDVLPAGSYSFVDDDVLCDVGYVYRVSAFNSHGINSSSVSTQVLTCPFPIAPTGLAVDAVFLSETGLDISWVDNNDREWGFIIERSETGADDWEEVGGVRENETRYRDQNLSCNTSYDYRVRAYNTYTSNPSTVATGVTNVCDMNTPTNLHATPVSLTRIDLDWVDAAAPIGSTHFDIIRTQNPNKQPWEWVATVPGDTFYHNEGLSCNTTYYYRVRARRMDPPDFTSGYTEPISATTVVCVSEGPSEAELVSAAPDAIGLLWSDNSDNEQGFIVERYLEDLSIWDQVGSTGADENFFLDTGLDCGDAYQYRVYAFNAGGDSAFSEIATLNSAVCLPTPASTLTSTRTTQTSIGLNWNDNSDDESGFTVQRSDVLGIEWQDVGETGEDETSFIDNSVTCGRTYTYRVAAFNAGGSAPASSPMLANSQVCTPILSAQALSSGVIGLTWMDDSQNVGEYGVYRKSSLEGLYTKIASLGANVHSYKDGTVSCLLGYSYKICGEIPGTANSSCSEVQSAHTTCLPLAPSSLSAELVAPNQIQLSWTDNSFNESGFIVLRSDNGGEGWIEVGRVGNNVHQFLDLGLGFDHLYLYRVAAYNAGGATDYSNQADEHTAIALFLPVLFK